MRCTIIGNGLSRKNYILKNIAGITFGCNQIYTEYRPTFLVAQDRHVLEQMSSDRVHTVFVPQERWRLFRNDSRMRHITNMQAIGQPTTGSTQLLSGHWCMLLAAQLGFTQLRLMGFDGGPDSCYRSHTDTNTTEVYQCTEQRDVIFKKNLLKQFPDLEISAYE
jgi:hypothetical protein